MWNNKNFDQFFIGFDKFFENMAQTVDTVAKAATKYPPFNIRRDGENKYVIELAVAGFGTQDLEIEMVDGKLIVKGNAESTEDDLFIHRGLAMRPFTRQFYLSDKVVVENAELINGVLKIFLEAVAPKENTKKIIINDGK